MKVKETYSSEFHEFIDSTIEESSGLSPAEDLLSGYNINSELSGVYDFEEFVAKGSVKVIHKMRDRKMGRAVALARLKKEYSNSFHTDRFLREAHILSQLEHPNIVPLYEINTDSEGTPFMIMKLLKGDSLATIINEISQGDSEFKEKYSIKTLLGIYLNVCNAIAYAHSKGIVHLDLKPENIQIDEFGSVWILDWGIARNIKPANESDEYLMDYPTLSPMQSEEYFANSINGTPGYISPEEIKGTGNGPNEGSDIYSLGGILYSMIYLNKPYAGMSAEQILKAVKRGETPDFPTSSSGEVVPAALKNIVLKAMAYEAEDRYSDVLTLHDDIQSYLHGFATLSEKKNPFARASLFYKRNKKSLNISLCFIAVIATVIFVAQLLLDKEKLLAEAQKKEASAYKNQIETTFDFVKRGAIEKEYAYVHDFDYVGAIQSYYQVMALGYIDSEIWFRIGKLHLMRLSLHEALKCFWQVNRDDFDERQWAEYLWYEKIVREYYEKSVEKPLTDLEYCELARTLTNYDIQNGIFWTLNNSLEKTLDQKLDMIPQYLVILSNGRLKRGDLNYSYKINFVTNGMVVDMDLSGNKSLLSIAPIMGLPLSSLDISNNPVLTLHSGKHFLKKQLSKLNISNTSIELDHGFIKDSNFETVIARGVTATIWNFFGIKHLDLEGAKLAFQYIDQSPNKIEYLNIAHTNFREYWTITNCQNLKTLVLDESMKMNALELGAMMHNKVSLVYH